MYRGKKTIQEFQATLQQTPSFQRLCTIENIEHARFGGPRLHRPKGQLRARGAALTMAFFASLRQAGGIMNSFTYRAAALLLAAALPMATAHAQLEGLMGKGGSKGELKGLAGGLSGKSLTSGSMGNVAGLLQYCVTNNYLGGADANSVKEKLTGKLPGGTASTDPGYNDGLKGLLHSQDGKQVDLSGGAIGASGAAGNVGSSGGGASGMQAEVTKKVCDTVMSQAKSML
jgi:hypothetical protein